MKLMNPFITMYESFSDATSSLEKAVLAVLYIWAAALIILSTSGIIAIAYELIVHPSTFNNATWGVFDTLG